MSPRIARKLIAELRITAPGASNESATSATELTPREIGILKLLEKGMSYSEVAAELGISTHTVHSHIKKITTVRLSRTTFLKNHSPSWFNESKMM